ncbi:MAG: hypothetical protein ACREGC_04455, partial [Minisyncoccia bacterium]
INGTGTISAPDINVGTWGISATPAAYAGAGSVLGGIVTGNEAGTIITDASGNTNLYIYHYQFLKGPDSAQDSSNYYSNTSDVIRVDKIPLSGSGTPPAAPDNLSLPPGCTSVSGYSSTSGLKCDGSNTCAPGLTFNSATQSCSTSTGGGGGGSSTQTIIPSWLY